ncbi:MAG: formyl transferase [Campylobacterota bacterium]|nr:formyl transferase [Campylobacterota bacterium]
MDKKFRIVMLIGRDDSSSIIYHALKGEFQVEKVIIEEPVPKQRVITNRIKRLGLWVVSGQILFILSNKLFSKFAISRIDEIKEQYQLDDSAIDDDKLLHVESINDQEVIEILQEIDPDAIVVNGTRIISGEVLDSLDKPFVNTHAGITPKYRGVHGGYWALVNDDAEHCGVTIHLVDRGIDTGEVLYQETICTTEADSFNTYPYLQLAQAIPLMKHSLRDIEESRLKIKKVDLPSKLWYHPTIWRYLWSIIKRGVK